MYRSQHIPEKSGRLSLCPHAFFLTSSLFEVKKTDICIKLGVMQGDAMTKSGEKMRNTMKNVQILTFFTCLPVLDFRLLSIFVD